MANPDVRAFAIYIENKKSATINKSNASFPGSRSPLFGSDGYLGHSRGALMCKLQVSEITPTSGSDLSALTKKWLNQENIQVGMFIGGSIFRVEMAIENLDFTSNSESGVAEGNATFGGGIPDIV